MTSALTGLSAQYFPLFPTLAPELQTMIWKQALPDGRFVHIRYCAEGSSDGYLVSSTPIPGTLHACSESRKITVQAGWSLEFGTDSNECQYCQSCKGVRAPEFVNELVDLLIRNLGTDQSSSGVDVMQERLIPTYRTAFGPGGILSSWGPELFGDGGPLFGRGEELLGMGGKSAGEDPAFSCPGGPLCGMKGRVWFNFDKDILYFPFVSDGDGHLLQPNHFTKTQLHKSLHNFPNVEELFIVSQHKLRPQTNQPAWYKGLIFKAQNMLSKAPQRNEINWWTFLDADISEAEYYSGPGFYYGRWGLPIPDVEEHESSPMSFWNDLFKKNEKEIERNIQRFISQGRPSKVPVNVRIGIVVAEKDVPLLLKQREEYWGTITKKKKSLVGTEGIGK